MTYTTYEDLSNCIRRNVWKVPADVDIIVGVPRSGMIPAPMLMEYGIRYFDGSRMFALTDRKPYAAYDTGASFWEACEELRLPYRGVRINEYVIHLGHGSWRRCDHSEWLEQHKELWKL